MTAIVGFTCFDGVLMMADTEETTSIYTKSSCDKLYRFTYPLGTVLTGGAGDAHLIDCANQELHQFFSNGIPQASAAPLDAEKIRKALNDFAQQFFSETTAKYAAAGLNPLPDFELLIAVNYDKEQTLLYRLFRNRVLWIAPSRHDCIGSGVVQLHPMLRDFQLMPTKETALFCGIRMMYHAKRIIQGVGGKTEAVALLHSGTVIYFGTENTERIEALVANFEEFIGKFVYTSVSNVSKTFPEIDDNCEENFKNFAKVFRQFRDSYKGLLNEPTL
jgi:hypothetical protein